MKSLASWYLRLRGWKFTGQIPDIPKMVIVGAPHTTNWDFVVFLGILDHFKLKMSFIGKHTLFRWPFGYLFRSLGGIPVNRARPGGIVDQVVAAINDAETMILVMAPEGTRKPAAYWKPGFLMIAEAAGIPILFGYVDFPSRTAGFGPVVYDAADRDLVMSTARDFYQDKQGLKPDGKGPIRLRGDN